ncbi:uncharacterized protein [Solanum tuberosum]|uniref:uncharacterized protein n=1 Tax=Solanum tuberosum TaxID=4113 RepID=UPI00073A37FD|nr:PREDICTED: uncharacterized protein LOC107058777 [Solanum tuberosum]
MGEVAYTLALPPSLSVVHPVFHISKLRKYMSDESQVLYLDLVELGTNLSIEDEPIAILDMNVQKLRTKDIVLVKVQWKRRSIGEATWETKSDMRAKYPHLFEDLGTFFCLMFEYEHGYYMLRPLKLDD